MPFFRRRKVRESLSAYGFILPFAVFCCAFAILPVLSVFKLSFQTGGFLDKPVWVGLSNYAGIFADPQYLGYFLNNLVYIAFSIPFGQFFAFTLALLLKEKTRASGFFESVFFLPLLLSMVAAGTIITYVFNLNGPVNYVLGLFRLEPVNWLGQPFTAKITIVIAELWKGATFYTFVYIAALRAVPAEYFEVGHMEGARWLQMLRRVTLPLVKNTILFCFVMTTIWQLQIFDSIYVMTSGGPMNTTMSVVFSIYQTTFKHFHVGPGSALSILFLVVILVISLIQMSLSRSDVEY